MDFTRLNIKGLQGASYVSSANSLTLAEKDRAFVVLCDITAGSKTVTLDLPEFACCIVANIGINTFTLKNVSGDTGTSVAAGKAFMIMASQTADGSSVVQLGGGTDPA